MNQLYLSAHITTCLFSGTLEAPVAIITKPMEWDKAEINRSPVIKRLFGQGPQQIKNVKGHGCDRAKGSFTSCVPFLVLFFLVLHQ